jgi:hypothetical protein
MTTRAAVCSLRVYTYYVHIIAQRQYLYSRTSNATSKLSTNTGAATTTRAAACSLRVYTYIVRAVAALLQLCCSCGMRRRLLFCGYMHVTAQRQYLLSRTSNCCSSVAAVAAHVIAQRRYLLSRTSNATSKLSTNTGAAHALVPQTRLYRRTRCACPLA